MQRRRGPQRHARKPRKLSGLRVSANLCVSALKFCIVGIWDDFGIWSLGFGILEKDFSEVILNAEAQRNAETRKENKPSASLCGPLRLCAKIFLHHCLFFWDFFGIWSLGFGFSEVLKQLLPRRRHFLV